MCTKYIYTNYKLREYKENAAVSLVCVLMVPIINLISRTTNFNNIETYLKVDSSFQDVFIAKIFSSLRIYKVLNSSCRFSTTIVRDSYWGWKVLKLFISLTRKYCLVAI